MECDPRDSDSRDDERLAVHRDRAGGDSSQALERDDDWRQPETSRDRDDGAQTLGRSPGDSRSSHSNRSGCDRDDPRWLERHHDTRERDHDVREVFTRKLNLPRGLEREIVRDRDREYTLRGSETRTLATVGTFRVVSSRDLRGHHKREYQTWLHERDRDRPDYDGHPDRTEEEIRDWALEHDLPYFDDEVHIPDLRIEYQEADGRRDHDDIEVTTEHYRGAHGASVARSGFVCYGGLSLRIGGGSGGGRGGGGHPRGLIEELWE